MADRTPLVAANWKMHMTRPEAGAFLDAFLPLAADRLRDVELVVCPPFTGLEAAARRCSETAVRVAAQNMHFERQGAYTGEVSAPMLEELGVEAVILGHSERRRLFAETDDALARKVQAALASGLVPILCVGESAEQRDAGETETILRGQVEADLARLADAELGRVVIAYEPIWAIGTGRNATARQAAEAIGSIRSLVAARDRGAAAAMRILYGGSVKPENASELLGGDGIDGALVGGASLDPEAFAAIAGAATR